jgi:hypothetical protein
MTVTERDKSRPVTLDDDDGMTEVERFIAQRGVTSCPPGKAKGAAPFGTFASGMGGTRGRNSGGN